jgi:hypothetical protein
LEHEFKVKLCEFFAEKKGNFFGDYLKAKIVTMFMVRETSASRVKNKFIADPNRLKPAQ